MKKIILISSISVIALAGMAAFLFLTKSTINAAEIAESKDRYIAGKTGLNLRSGPDKSAKVITIILFGEKVSLEKSDGKEIFLDGRYGKWVNVKYGDKTGWVFSGFLCEFKPDTIIKVAADYYRNEYRNDKNSSENKELTHFKDSEVYIRSIMDNYIILSIPNDWSCKDVVWRFDAKQKKFFETYKGEFQDVASFYYLDDDRYADLVVKKGGGVDSDDVKIFLGSKDGFVKIYNSHDSGCCDKHHYTDLTIGRCGDTEFIYSQRDSMFFLRFNCKTKKMEKFGEGKIFCSEGIVTSVDFKNRSVVIRDGEDLKNNTYKFGKSDSLENMKTFIAVSGDRTISFIYVILDGKRILMGFNRDSYRFY